MMRDFAGGPANAHQAGMVARLDGSKRDPLCRQVIVKVREFHEEIRKACSQGRYPEERHSN
jgi:hypothetical protein